MSEVTDEMWDFDLSNPGEAHDDPGLPFVHFVKLRFFPGVPVKRFVKGERLELPGVKQTDWNVRPPVITDEPFSLAAMKIDPKSKDKIFYIVAEDTNRDGGTIHNVFRFKNWNEPVREVKKDEAGLDVVGEDGYPVREVLVDEDGKRVNERNTFFDFQLPELKKLPGDDYKKLQMTGRLAFTKPDDPKTWVYAKYSDGESGYTKGFEVQRYLKDITIFKNKAEWEAAKEAAKNEAGTNSTGKSSEYGHYPAGWEKNPALLVTEAKRLLDKEKSHKEIAIGCALMDKEGNPMDTIGGNGKVDVKALLAEILDTPEPMISLEE